MNYGKVVCFLLGNVFIGFLLSCNGSVPLSHEHPVKGPLSEKGNQVILATTDLSIGENRFAFLVLSERGFINAEYAEVIFYPPSNKSNFIKNTAPLIHWGNLNRGSFITHVNFPYEGEWNLVVNLIDLGTNASMKASFPVYKNTVAPSIGDTAPQSKNKTISNVRNLRELSTGDLIEPELYKYSIDESLKSGKPTVLTFASPAFCQDETCGPQVKVLDKLHESKSDSANFIHVEIYDNPVEVQNGSQEGIYSEPFKKWNLPSSEWTFIINCSGEISERYQGFVSIEELGEALMASLLEHQSNPSCSPS